MDRVIEFSRMLFPSHLRVLLKDILLALPGGHKLLRQYIPTFVIAYPKCGRTWLRLMIGKAFQEHFDLELNASDLMETDKFHYIDKRIPYVRFIHDDDPHFKHPDGLALDKTRYRGTRVILLVRDPRDVVVSNFFEYTKRGGKRLAGDEDYQGDLSLYLRYEIGSLETMIRFYNIWARNKQTPSSFLLVRYEDVHENTSGELRRVLDFLGLAEISDEVVHESVSFASFKNMHRMEKKDAFLSDRLRPGDKDDPESYKTRRGKVGGYVDYLSKEDINYLNQRIRAELDSYYGY
jgi:hypothetical protein